MAFESQLAYELSALRGEAQPRYVAEDDYQSFSAALGASARGRAFLHEYAKRNRHADTEVVLEALFRLERVAGGHKSAPEAERIRQELRALLNTIHSARPQIDASPGAIKSATLTALIEFVQARIEGLVTPVAVPGERGFLSPVPQAEQPELPIPHPGSTAQRSIALVQPIAPPIGGEPARPAPDPLVLSLDPRVGPVFGQQPGSAVAEAPRPTQIIPEVNFIDSLFDQIDARAAHQADIDAMAEAMALSPPPVANTNVPATQQTARVQDAATETAQEAASAIAAALAALAAPATASLPPLELSPVEATAVAGETAQITSDVVEQRAPDPVVIDRAEALARTATAIDSIVAAAAEVMAEAKIAEATLATTAVDVPAAGEADLAETSFSDIAFPAVAIADPGQLEAEFVETAFIETQLADAEEGEATFVEATFVEAAFVETGVVETGVVESVLPETGSIEAKAAEAKLSEAATSEAIAALPLSEEAELPAVLAEDAPASAALETAAIEPAVIEPVAEPEGNVAVAAALPMVMPVTDNIAEVAAGDSSQKVWDNALAEIMALSEDERLALFT